MILAIMCGSNIVIYVLTRIYYGWRNKVREHDWSTMSRQVSYTTDLDMSMTRPTDSLPAIRNN